MTLVLATLAFFTVLSPGRAQETVPIVPGIAYFSFQGYFDDPLLLQEQEFRFDLATQVSSADALNMRTYHHGGSSNAPGGTNAAGDVINTGGFDSVLTLTDDLGAVITWNDNFFPNPNADAVLAIGGLTPNIPVPLNPGTYRVKMKATHNLYPASHRFWAFDIAGIDDQLTLRGGGVSKGSHFDSLKLGTKCYGGACFLQNPARLNLRHTSLSFGDRLVVAQSGVGELTLDTTDVRVRTAFVVGARSLSNGTVSLVSGSALLGAQGQGHGPDTIIGDEAGSMGMVHADDFSEWIARDLTVGKSGSGILRVSNDATVTSNGNVFIAAMPGSEGTVELIGPSSTLTVDDSVYVGGNGATDGGIGELNVTGPFSELTFGNQNPNAVLKIYPNGIVSSCSATLNVPGTHNTGSIHIGCSPGTLTLNGDFTQGRSGTLEIDLFGPAPNEYDRLIVRGDVSLGGTLDLRLSGDFTPRPGDRFKILTARGRIAGNFSEVRVPPGFEVDTSSLLTSGEVSLTRESAPFRRGDSNNDGTVDISDTVATLGVLFLGQGEIACQDAADSNDDGAVDISDAVATLGVLFLGHGQIPLPGINDCGVDPTADQLHCETYERC